MKYISRITPIITGESNGDGGSSRGSDNGEDNDSSDADSTMNTDHKNIRKIFT